jgi:glycosyltransferase involved in cell wall biosynthesis
MNAPDARGESAPSVTGLRVAFVVYNDVHGDSRVLKVAKTLEDAGASVRIFAASSDAGRYPDGLDHSLDDLAIYRLPSLAFQTWARRVRARTTPAPTAAPAVPAATLSTSTPPQQPSPTSARARLQGMLAATYGVVVQWLFWKRIERPIVRWAPDVVHAHDANTLPAASRAARRSRAKLIYDSHELWTDRNVVRPRPYRDWLDPRIERAGIRRADAVITVSPSIVRFLRDTYALDPEPTLVRNVPPYGGDTEAVGSLRRLAQLSEDDVVVAYCGSITTNRGVEATIDTLPHLDARTHFVLLGEGQPAYVAGLTHRARALGVEDRVHFVGRVPSAEVPGTLADADVSVVFTVPICKSYLWSLPNKLFESIHAGVPIVASDIPDVASLVAQTGVGLTAPLDDVEQLARAIRSAIADSERFRAQARATARTLNWQTESRTLLALYERVTGQPLPIRPN